MPADPAELVAGCRDVAEKPICSAMVEGSMANYEEVDLRI
jgi:hypothetical protein